MATENYAIHQYEIVGRRKPETIVDKVDGLNKKLEQQSLFRMRLFAPNVVIAKSRFWYYLSLLKKIKRANGEIVEVHEIFEKNSNVIRNYGMWIRYDSRSGTHNMYKEYRATSLNEAVRRMYTELASRHRARRSSIQIVKTAVIKAKDCKRVNTLQFHNASIKFRLLHRIPRASNKDFRSTFSATKPSQFF